MLRAGALHAIGRPFIPNFADPLGLMSHCHRKIEGYLAGLAFAGEILRRGRSEELAEAFRLISDAREHFAVRGPKHTEDEEESLFPRMLEFGGREAEEALSALSELESQHRLAEIVHTEFDELAGRLRQDGSAPEKELERYSELVEVMRDIYSPHIRIEDEIIFPSAARIIPAGILLTIGQEMKARRRELLMGLRPSAAVHNPAAPRG